MKISREDLSTICETGIDWAIEKGYAWPEDKQFCEDDGRLSDGDMRCLGQKAVHRGLTQVTEAALFSYDSYSAL
jgi:tRNA-splicing ligase RtcB (3'-phosphate/5'-hydroxy nucleic acid ligase)